MKEHMIYNQLIVDGYAIFLDKDNELCAVQGEPPKGLDPIEELEPDEGYGYEIFELSLWTPSGTIKDYHFSAEEVKELGGLPSRIRLAKRLFEKYGPAHAHCISATKGFVKAMMKSGLVKFI